MRVTALSLLILVASLNAFAADPAPPDSSNAEVHTNKARVLIEQKDWEGAAAEVRTATQLNPKSADAWLILGTAAMRLEKNAEALDAFKKYLELNPPADKATAVRQRIAEVEVRLDKQRKEEEAAAAVAAKANSERFGPKGSGFYLGFSPSFKPAIAGTSDLNSTISSYFDFGFRIQIADVGLRFGSGTVDGIIVKDDQDAVIPAPTAGAYSNGKHTLSELYTRVYFAVNSPPEGKPGTQFLIPMYIGMFMNNVKFAKTYWNMGMNVGLGGQFRWYSGSHFTFDVTGLYTASIPATGIQNNDTEIETVYNVNGKKAAGSLTGMDLRAGITILF